MPTRLYFPVSDAAAVSPSFDGGWEYVSEALRRKLADTKGSSAITVGSQIGPWTPGQDALDRQYISTRMNAGITFTNGSTSAKLQLMVREYANADNVLIGKVAIKIVSEDGNTVRATVLSLNNYGNLTEFINNATHRNKSFLDGDLMNGGSNYTTVLGDRILVEIGYQDSGGASPEASAKWGENANDLPEDNAQTSDGAGWVEFSNTITFAGESNNYVLTVVAGSYSVTGNTTALRWNRVLPFSAGSYSVSGNTVGLAKGYRLTIVAGSYSVAGNNPTLKADRKLSFSAGSYATTGNQVSLSKGHKLTVEQGSYAVNGGSVSLRLNRKLTTEIGAYSTTGNSLSLLYNRKLTTEVGSYSSDGNAVSLLSGLKIALSGGSYLITGNDVGLTHGTAGSYQIITESGSYLITGSGVQLKHSRLLGVESGSYQVTGNPVTLSRTRVLAVESGVYLITGSSVTLLKSGGAEEPIPGESHISTMVSTDSNDGPLTMHSKIKTSVTLISKINV